MRHLPLLLVGLHSLAVLLTVAVVASLYKYPEAEMLWVFVMFLDFPVTLLLGFIDFGIDDLDPLVRRTAGYAIVFAIGGGLQWYAIGWIVRHFARPPGTQSSHDDSAANSD